MIGFGLIGLVAVVLAIMWGVYKLLKSHPTQELNPNPSQLVQENIIPPGPRLQTNPAADLRTFRAREDSVLNSYGWVDQKNGVARIPIDSAIEMIAKRGLPMRHTSEGGR